MITIHKAVKKYEDRTKHVEYATTRELAKARIRNHVYCEEPAEWETSDEEYNDDEWLANPKDDDVTASITTVGVHGSLEDLRE